MKNSRSVIGNVIFGVSAVLAFVGLATVIYNIIDLSIYTAYGNNAQYSGIMEVVVPVLISVAAVSAVALLLALIGTLKGGHVPLGFVITLLGLAEVAAVVVVAVNMHDMMANTFYNDNPEYPMNVVMINGAVSPLYTVGSSVIALILPQALYLIALGIGCMLSRSKETAPTAQPQAAQPAQTPQPVYTAQPSPAQTTQTAQSVHAAQPTTAPTAPLSAASSDEPVSAKAVRYCNKCGGRLTPGAYFCTKCGAPTNKRQ